MLNYSPSGNLQCVMAQFIECLEDKERSKSTLIISWIAWGLACCILVLAEP